MRSSVVNEYMFKRRQTKLRQSQEKKSDRMIMPQTFEPIPEEPWQTDNNQSKVDGDKELE